MFTIAYKVFLRLFIVLVFAGSLVQPANARTFKTYLTTLIDPCGEPMVVRGVNAGIAFPSDPAATKLAEVSQSGANPVRLTFRWLINRSDPTSVETAIRKAVENHMVAMPSVWDATGRWNQLSFAVEFWTQPEMVSVLRQYEDMVLLNIANEAGAGDVSKDEFWLGYQGAIQKLRAAGLHMPLVIDAANYGRDADYLFAHARTLISNDPDHKLLFSWHPWDAGLSPADYQAVIDKAISLNINLLLGEFSSVDANEQGAIDYRYLMQYAAEKNIGWLWWWWSSGNTADKHALTVDGYYGNWANVGDEVVSTSPFGIGATSRRTAYLENRTCSPAMATPVPPAPTQVQAVATEGAEISLSWQYDLNYWKILKNFDIEVWDEVKQNWRLVKSVSPITFETTIGAGSEFVYSMDSQRDPSLDYSTSYRIRVGSYNTRDAVSYSDPITVTTNPDPRVCSNGDGLEADYYDVRGSWPGFLTTDAQINFDWGTGSPDPSDPTAPTDHFSVAWYGEIEPQFDGEYAFYTDSDDFARVWINGELVIDNWRAFAKGWGVGKIQLAAGVKYAILVEYEEWDGSAKMSLHWASTKLKRELVPQCRLFTPPAG